MVSLEFGELEVEAGPGLGLGFRYRFFAVLALLGQALGRSRSLLHASQFDQRGSPLGHQERSKGRSECNQQDLETGAHHRVRK
ncbi:hypothetical protein C1702_00240 [Caldimonas thermodepolymerans]|uniref:Uncharacterized protein n=1 Tax=Caldimonas thermodepolymerans TaxID=215580 RepID=A0A2S5T9C4_9BURK|nr:hypothetical protein C1702_00240 [Caldimonas thermodepolymerans]